MPFQIDAETLKNVYAIIRDLAALLSPTFLIWDRLNRRPKVKCKIREAILIWESSDFRHSGDVVSYTSTDFILRLQLENTGSSMTSVSDLSISFFDERGSPIAVHPAAVNVKPSKHPVYKITPRDEQIIALEPNRVVREDIEFRIALESTIRTAPAITAKLRIEFVNYRAIEMDIPYQSPQRSGRAR